MSGSWSHFPWWHTWRPVASEQFTAVLHYTLQGVVMDGPDIQKPRTRVLYRCDCGATTTTELPGHWTIEQVKP